MDTERSYSSYPLSELTAQIIGAAQAVHRGLGPGFRETVYQRALEHELHQRGLDAAREVWIEVHYRGLRVGRHRVDFVVGDASGAVMVEIKARHELEDVHFVQTLSYLKASGYPIGLLVNFGAKSLQVRRIANTRH